MVRYAGATTRRFCGLDTESVEWYLLFQLIPPIETTESTALPTN
jgi:hypothetical protein